MDHIVYITFITTDSSVRFVLTSSLPHLFFCRLLAAALSILLPVCHPMYYIIVFNWATLMTTEKESKIVDDIYDHTNRKCHLGYNDGVELRTTK